MKYQDSSITAAIKTLRIAAISWGIYVALGLIIYFLLMKMLNLHQNVNLHFGNFVVLFIGLWFAIKKTKTIDHELKYFEGLKAGLLVTIISVILFDLFMLFYISVIDKPFLEILKQHISFGPGETDPSTILKIIGLITIEGLSSGFIMTFIIMQYFKNSKSQPD